MEKGKTPKQRVPQKPAKTSTFCILCRIFYTKYEAQKHVHSMLHHREMETVLGNDLFHECQACEASSMGLNEYAKHISTADHKAKLKTLTSRCVKPPSLDKTLGTEAVTKILERNKTRKKEEKKATKKKKKKLKQIAGQQHKETLQRSATKDTAGFKQMYTNAQWQDAHQRGGNVVFYQNKENKVFSLQRPPYNGEPCFQNQGEGFHYLSGGPSGRTWHQPYAWDEFQSSHNTRYNDNLSVNNRSVDIKMQISQTDILNKTPQNREAPEHITWPGTSQYDYYNMQSNSAANKDFTSDNLPQNGAILFDHCHTESSGSSQPAQKGSHCSANPASVNGSATAAPIRDIDVSVMLRQIRRALGVREPCRADREAKKQNKVAGTDKAPPSASSAQNPVVSYPGAAAHSAISTSSISTAQPKQATSKMAEENTQHCKKSFVVADSLSSSKETQGLLKSPVSIRQSSKSKTTLSEPSLNKSHKVRTAHIPKRAQEGEDSKLKPTLSKLSSNNLQEGMKRRKRDSVKGMPRFGMRLAKPPTDRGSSTQPQDNDSTLSEGFHWESIPDMSSDPRSTLPSLPAEPTNLESRTETQTQPQLQEPLEQPDTAKQIGTSRKEIIKVSVKVEPNSEYKGEGSSEHSKRKLKTSPDDGISDQGPSKKKKKTKSNKDQHQMDQLLAVSLREDELSHSLHDLDKSLIQARNALQAAYTEVQRLLLLKQQFMSEVNSLRAKRIEILQGMQEGYSGTSNVAEKATTSSAGASLQPRFSPLPSSVANQQLPAPTLTPLSVTQPHATPLALPIKQEIHTLPTAAQTSHFANTDAPPVTLNQPVSFFPPDLLAPVLLTPPHLDAAPPAAATTKRLLSSESDSEESTEGNGGKEQEKLKLSGVKISALKNSPAAALDSNDGSESDDSVEMMEPSDPVVIAIDESDHEDSRDIVSKVSFHPEPPRTPVSVPCSASTQTSQQHIEERKVKVSATPVKNASASPHELDSVEDEEPSLGEFGSHTGPVHGLQIHDGLLYTCSGDNTARAYSLATRECQAVFTGHTNKINCLLVSSLPNLPARLYTGSSDQTIRCYSVKSKKCLEQLSLPDRVLCLHIAWRILYVGLANGSVASYDLKTLKQLDVFECHGPRGVSCLATAQEGARRVLLVGSYDSTISVRDTKSGLLLRSLQGHTKTVLCMKVVNDLVFSGSSDTSVHAHNIHTGELVRIYKGHGHAVTSIVILGKVMVTACLDKLVRVYELQSHDRLQVYGGHSDMVMCMAVHKSVIYTGCYDGSVQAVKLNLMKNYRCWWQNCTLIFGIAEHLVQHLVKDHSNQNLQTVKCRWKSCDKFFATQQAVRQELPEHMQNHVESDSKVQS